MTTPVYQSPDGTSWTLHVDDDATITATTEAPPVVEMIFPTFSKPVLLASNDGPNYRVAEYEKTSPGQGDYNIQVVTENQGPFGAGPTSATIPWLAPSTMARVRAFDYVQGTYGEWSEWSEPSAAE